MRLISAVLAFVSLPLSALADEIVISDAYVRVSGPMARAAAAFMTIENQTGKDITLVAVETDVAKMTGLHTHIIEDDIAKMRPLEDGITIAPGMSHELKRGEDHVMLMGLTQKLQEGDLVKVMFLFENAEPIAVEIPVNNGQNDTGGTQ